MEEGAQTLLSDRGNIRRAFFPVIGPAGRFEASWLVSRIADYMRVTGSPEAYMNFARTLWGHEEQVYPDISHALFEGLLKLEPDDHTAQQIRQFASSLLRCKESFEGGQH